MGFLDTLLGKSTAQVSAPDRPEDLNPLIGAQQKNLLQQFQDPANSDEFQNFLKIINNQTAQQSGKFIDTVNDQFGSPGGPGLQAGAAGKVKQEGLLQIFAGSDDATRKAFGDLLGRRDATLDSLIARLFGFEIQGAQVEASSLVKQGGLLDVAGGISSMAADLTPLGQASGFFSE